MTTEYERELEITRHRMEILRMARQMLNEEYINRRAEDHNRWLAEADVAWRTKGIKLPYPPFAPYPTEEQVLAKAQELLKFVVEPKQAAGETKPEPTTTEATKAEASKTETPKSAEPLVAAAPLPQEALPTAPHAPPVATMTPTVDSGPLLKEMERLRQINEQEKRFLFPGLGNLNKSQ